VRRADQGRRIKREREKIPDAGRGRGGEGGSYECARLIPIARAGEQASQRTRNYRRGYIRALSLPGGAVVSSRLRSRAATSYDIFCGGTKDCAPRPQHPPSLPRHPSSSARSQPPPRPLKGPYRPAKSADYPRTIVPLFTSRRGPPRRIR